MATPQSRNTARAKRSTASSSRDDGPCYAALMNRRHAAAIALLGWYLLAPMFDKDNGKVLPNVPLGKWQNLGSFDTASECRAQLADFQKQLGANGTIPLNEGQEGAKQFVCIATDDPRLAK